MLVKVQHGGNVEKVAKRLGLSETPDTTFDFSVNLNPVGPPPAVKTVLDNGADITTRYPDEYAEEACNALAAAHGLPPEHVLIGNGATEIIGCILQALRPASAGTVAPTYSGYAQVCAAAGLPTTEAIVLSPDNGFEFGEPEKVRGAMEVIFVGSPNNPTGRLVPPTMLCEFSRRNPTKTVVADISFIDFTGPPCPEELKPEKLPPNMVVVKSLTTFFCIPGLRLGIGWAQPELVELIKKVRLPWTVNGLAQELALSLYADAAYMERSRTETQALRERFGGLLATLPDVSAFRAEASFVLARLPQDWLAARLQGELLRRGFLIRSCEDFVGLDARYCRLTVRPEPEQDALIEALRSLLTAGA